MKGRSSATQRRLAVDIGGTFTDVALGTPAGLFTAKSLTTAADPVQGVHLLVAHPVGPPEILDPDHDPESASSGAATARAPASISTRSSE